MSFLAAVALVAAALAPAAAPQQLFDLPDSRITEASGIARGIASPDVYYVQNDSGDSARFFAIDARTGALRAVVQVPGAVNHDWEDLAVAPDAAGTPSVWIADIGDNDANRDEVQLYRVDEPHIVAGGLGGTVTTAAPDVWRLRYPSGPANAESLAVTPAGRAYVFTKNATGAATAYAVPPRPDPDHVQVMRPHRHAADPAARDRCSDLARRFAAGGTHVLRRVPVAAAPRRRRRRDPGQADPGDAAGAAAGRGRRLLTGALVVDSEGVAHAGVERAAAGGARPTARSGATSTDRSRHHRSRASPSPSPTGSSHSNSTKSPLLATLALIAAGCVFLAVRKLRRRG